MKKKKVLKICLIVLAFLLAICLSFYLGITYITMINMSADSVYIPEAVDSKYHFVIEETKTKLTIYKCSPDGYMHTKSEYNLDENGDTTVLLETNQYLNSLTAMLQMKEYKNSHIEYVRHNNLITGTKHMVRTNKDALIKKVVDFSNAIDEVKLVLHKK